MRAQARQIAHDEEEESAFVSMTDMTVGFLFIIMILLVFFASQVRNQDVVERSIYDDVVVERDEWRDLAGEMAERNAMLEEELARVAAERDSLRALLRDIRIQVADLETQIEEARIREAALRERIENLDAQVAERNRTIAELRTEIEKARIRESALWDWIEILDLQVADRDRTISELRGEIERLEEELRQLRTVDPLEAYLARVADTRQLVLIRLRDALLEDFPDLQVELSEESDALRFQGEGLFVSGQSTLGKRPALPLCRVQPAPDSVHHGIVDTIEVSGWRSVGRARRGATTRSG